MRKQNGLTLIELLIVIVIIVVFLWLIIPPPHPRNRAYGALCMSNMHILTEGWYAYSNENKNALIGGDIGQLEFDWIPKPVVSDLTDIEGQKDNMQNGKLWPYVKNVEMYHCPADDRIENNKGPWLSYSIVGGLNGQDREEEDKRKYKAATKYDQVKYPEEKIVFVEEDAEFGWNPRSWQIYYPQDQTKWTWQNPMAIRHYEMSAFSFADGHAQRYKWKDEHTLAMSKPPAETGTMAGHTVGHVERKENPDLLWMKERYTWVEKN